MPKVLLHRRIHSANLSQDQNALARERVEILKVHLDRMRAKAGFVFPGMTCETDCAATGWNRQWKYLWSYLRFSRLRLLGCITLALAQSVSLLPIAWLVRRVFDIVIPSHRMLGLLTLGVEILALNSVANGLTLATPHTALRTSKRAIQSMRRDLVVQCQTLPPAFHDVADRGRLHTLLVQDSQLVDVMINALISGFFHRLF